MTERVGERVVVFGEERALRSWMAGQSGGGVCLLGKNATNPGNQGAAEKLYCIDRQQPSNPVLPGALYSKRVRPCGGESPNDSC